MEDIEQDLRALVDYVSKAGRVTKVDVVARFRWLPSRAIENLREGVRRGLLVRVEPEEDEPMSYIAPASAR